MTHSSSLQTRRRKQKAQKILSRQAKAEKRAARQAAKTSSGKKAAA